MTTKKEPDDNIYCHQALGYTAKIVIKNDLPKKNINILNWTGM